MGFKALEGGFSRDLSALPLNTATLGLNLDGTGAGWSPEQVIDACAARGFGGIVFWWREIGARAVATGNYQGRPGCRSWAGAGLRFWWVHWSLPG